MNVLAPVPAAAVELPACAAVILAGGRGSRLGGVDKGLLEVGGRPLVLWVLEALGARASAVYVSANRNLPAYAELGARHGFALVSDDEDDFRGPLAGVAAALERAESPLVFSCPCDSPALDGSLIDLLRRHLLDHEAEIAVARDSERLQPVFALYRRDLAAKLRAWLAAGGRKIDRWFAECRAIEVAAPEYSCSFVNINTPEELRLFVEKGVDS